MWAMRHEPFALTCGAWSACDGGAGNDDNDVDNDDAVDDDDDGGDDISRSHFGTSTYLLKILARGP